MFKKISFLITVLLLTAGIYAQVTTSSMNGTVKSPKGEDLSGASITVTHVPTGTVYRTISRNSGSYNILNMNPGGPYSVVVTFVGFDESKATDIYLALGDSYKLDFNLTEKGGELTGVTVTGTRTNRSTKSGASTNISNRQITSLPTISRSINDYTRLTPQGGNGSSFNGRDGRYNNITIDGANFNNSFGLSSNNLPGGDAQPISLDAIEEISVNISPFDVKQGNFTGAGISAITKSGTNNFKGSVYTYYRDQSFNGKKIGDAKLGPQDESKSKIYGARIGGPIIKNKLFFFINAERETRSYPGLNWMASRPGSNTPGGNVTRVLASDLDAVSNYVRTNFGYETGAYENIKSFSSRNSKYLGRLDWNINDNHKLSVRYNRVNSENDQTTNGTSAPNPRSSSNRWSNNSMAYDNANYGFEDLVSSWSIDLKSKVGRLSSNQFLATYTNIATDRTSGSTPFPFIDIQDGSGDAYISLGYELFSYQNSVKNKVATFTDNFSFTKGKHSFTAGASFDYLSFGNSFLRYGTSYYRFSSVNDFLTNQAPNAYALTYGYDGKDPIAELKFGQFAAYFQDEIKVNDKLKLLIGIRGDKAIYINDPAANDAIKAKTFKDLDGNDLVFDVSKWPESKTLFSPRIGFNYDVKGNRDLIVRGGTGIFTGRLPFVWYTNQPTNSYALQATVEKVGSAAAPFLFNPDPKAYVNQFPQNTSTLPSGASLAIVDKNFKFPQVWRSSLAFDKRLPWDFLVTMEAIYTKDVNAILQYNANQAAPNSSFSAGPDQRPRYTSSAARTIDGSVREAMVLANTDRGNGFSYTVLLSRNFKKGFFGQIAYSYNHTMDLSSNPGSQAASAWSNLNSIRGNNDLDLYVSQSSVPHRVSGAASYRFEYLNKKLSTTVSLFYEGSSTGRFSYRYSNDMNNDGLSNDLMYIPKDLAEAKTMIPNAADADAFWAYLEQDKYLSKHKGQYAENYEALQPWYNRLDFKLLQDFTIQTGSRSHSLQASLDILNFGNFLSKNWGINYRNVVSNGGLLRYSTTTGGIPQYTFNKVSGDYPTRTFEPSIAVGSTWGMQIGLRYLFE